LETGRFWVIADFEQITQSELFQVVSHSGQAEGWFSNGGGVSQTGPACFRTRLADPQDELVISNENAVNWSLKSDWRGFWLLTAAVYCDRDALPVQLSLDAGPDGRASHVHSRIVLARGWNLLRLDLAEAAESIPLDDVRAVRVSLPEADGPTDLTIDDLILADNREDLFGSADDPDQGLYVQRQGRRWNIGAAGRFELSFANGQIVRWSDLGSDPNRLRNLVAGTVLGPSPVVVPDFVEEPATQPATDFADLGAAVVARQRLIEASTLRVVVEADWSFTASEASPPEQIPSQQWTYTLYRDGRVYVRTECVAGAEQWRPPGLGVAVSCAETEPLEALAHSAAGLDGDERLRHVTYGYADSASPNGACMLVIMYDSRRAPRMEVVRQLERHRLSLLASGGEMTSGAQTWSSLLRVWPPGHCGEAAPQALDYCYAAGLEIHTGERIIDSPGDDDHDGFNESEGCYVVRAEAGTLRLVIDGSKDARYSPVFKVVQPGSARAWVYVDNLILEPVIRDPAGNLLFQIPGTVRKRTLVEVVLAPAETTPSS